MLGWFHALLPREDNFFRLFKAHAETLSNGAGALSKMLEGGPETSRWCKQIVDHDDLLMMAAAGRVSAVEPHLYPVRPPPAV